MLDRVDADQEGRQQKRVRKARIAAAFDVPGCKLAIATVGGDRDPDGRPTLRVGVEDEAGPPRLGRRPRDEVRDGDDVVVHDRLVERCERRGRDRVLTPVESDAETTHADSWGDLDIDRERRTADLLEPEAVLFDEIEREPIGAGRPGRGYLELELDAVARRDGMGERCPRSVPDDGVSELVEPMEGNLDPLGPVRAPRCAAGILECDARDRRDPCPLRLEFP